MMNTNSPYTLIIMLAFFMFSCSKESKNDSAKEEDKVVNTGPSPTSFTDIRDNKTYKLVTIGNQTWFAENLAFEIEGSYIYDNDSNNLAAYGRLYTIDAALKACPSGFHVPTAAEWDTLINRTGGYNGIGGDLKEAGTVHWLSPNRGAIDSFNFSLRGSGYSTQHGEYKQLKAFAYLWTTKNARAGRYTTQIFQYDKNGADHNTNSVLERLAVRCVMD